MPAALARHNYILSTAIEITDDARTALNLFELAVQLTRLDEQGVIHIDDTVAEEGIERRVVRDDKGGDEHYDPISAFIKLVRGSDPDAALYWLAEMMLARQDPELVMRRLLIPTGENIGIAGSVPGTADDTAACRAKTDLPTAVTSAMFRPLTVTASRFQPLPASSGPHRHLT